MVFAGGTLGLILLALWVFCLVDVITTPEGEVRNLPKIAWIFIVLLLPDVGSIIWLIAGRPRGDQQRPGGLPYKGNTGRFPEYERPGRQLATNPDDDEAFLRKLRERAEEQRRAAREARKAAEEADRDTEDPGGPTRK